MNQAAKRRLEAAGWPSSLISLFTNNVSVIATKYDS